MIYRALLVSLALLAIHAAPRAENASPSKSDRELAAYFRAEVGVLSHACLADVQTLADWQAQRDERRRQLFEMLGLWPLPPRSDLKPVITGRIEQDTFTVENLHFQSLPGLYVTANLYVPRNLSKPAPAILYVCGHAEVKTNGISCGNKTAYQHHGVWFARHGYVCLVIDTLQLGEIQGLHHGTYRLGQWWWNARGYTPAGVEAWNSIRALDYLETRPEVDRTRIGMTGRSGGGSYTWTTAALDERVKVAAPVAGMTDLHNQVLDGCVEGHCDCMFFVNTYRWDFPLNAALIAPRSLLIVNSDADDIFPLDGVERLHAKLKGLYQLYGATNHLGLVIGPGPHKDTQDLQVPVFRWFNHYLKGEDPLITDAATPLFPPMALRVFDVLPEDQLNTNIQATFVPAAAATSPAEPETVLARLRESAFRGWPSDHGSPIGRRVSVEERSGLRFCAFDFDSQEYVPLRLFLVQPAGQRRPRELVLHVLDAAGWTNWLATYQGVFERALADTSFAQAQTHAEPVPLDLGGLARELKANHAAWAWFAPRGVGLGAWSGDAKKQIQIRRRFMLMGQTLDGMRVWDIRRAAHAVRSIYNKSPTCLHFEAQGPMAVNALYASLFETNISALNLRNLPLSHRDGPDYLNVLKILDVPQARQLAESRLVRPSARRD